MKKVCVKIVNTTKQYLKWTFRSTFYRKKQFSNRAIVIKKEKCRIKLNKPIYI